MVISKKVQILLVALVAALSSCSLLPTDSDNTPIAALDDVVVINAAGEAIFVAAFALDVMPYIDPLPSFDPSDSQLPRIAPGVHARISVTDIGGFSQGSDLSILLYAIRLTRGDEAPGPPAAILVGEISVNNEELRRNDGRVVIREL